MTFYCCDVDYLHEPLKDVRFFTTVEELKEKMDCWTSCGISKITIHPDGRLERELILKNRWDKE